MFKRYAAALVILSLAACAAPHPRRAQPHAAAPPDAALPALPAAGDYKIDSANSEVRLLVYRAGPLARLGHNHVMVNRAITGQVRIADNLAASAFSLNLPASGFTVDDAQSRSEEGEDFPGEIPEDAKVGTRRNMLSAAVLNAADFPDITVKSVSLNGTLGAATAQLQISAAGHRSSISAPLVLHGDGHRIVATGTMELKQTALGLAPYSLMGGALQVLDAMQLKFTITALPN